MKKNHSKNHSFPLATTLNALYLGVGNKSTYKDLENVTIPNIISVAVSFSIVAVFVTFFFFFLFGGFRWITSAGDEKKLTAARSQLTHAFIGLFIVLSIWAIINLIQTLFGIDILTNGLTIPSFSPKIPYQGSGGDPLL